MWGKNESGQLGNGTTLNQQIPLSITDHIRLLPLESIQQFALGSSHSGLLTSFGRLLMWGRNVYGQVGDGTKQSKDTPTDITALFTLSSDDSITNLRLGWGHTAILTSNNDIFTWGFNQFGQLGDGSNEDTVQPKNISSRFLLGLNETIEQLYIRNGQSAFLTSSQRIQIWGLNQYGQLGNGNNLNQHTSSFLEVSLQNDESIVTLALGIHHSALLTTNGRLFTWGSNLFGQLGDATHTQVNSIATKTLHYLYTYEDIIIQTPYSVELEHIQNITWYDSIMFNQEITFPITMTEDRIIYGKQEDES